MGNTYSPLNDLRRGTVLRAESALQPDTSFQSRFDIISATGTTNTTIFDLTLPVGMFEHQVYGALISRVTAANVGITDNWFIGELQFSCGEKPVVDLPVQFFEGKNPAGTAFPPVFYQSVYTASTVPVQDGIFINFANNIAPPIPPALFAVPFRFSGSVDRVRFRSTQSLLSAQVISYFAIKSFNTL